MLNGDGGDVSPSTKDIESDKMDQEMNEGQGQSSTKRETETEPQYLVVEGQFLANEGEEFDPNVSTSHGASNSGGNIE